MALTYWMMEQISLTTTNHLQQTGVLVERMSSVARICKKMRSLKLIADTEPNANNIIRYVKEKCSSDNGLLMILLL